jgi:hypothetical protein
VGMEGGKEKGGGHSNCQSQIHFELFSMLINLLYKLLKHVSSPAKAKAGSSYYYLVTLQLSI